MTAHSRIGNGVRNYESSNTPLRNPLQLIPSLFTSFYCLQLFVQDPIATTTTEEIFFGKAKLSEIILRNIPSALRFQMINSSNYNNEIQEISNINNYFRSAGFRRFAELLN